MMLMWPSTEYCPQFLWFGEGIFFPKECHSTTHSERSAQQSEGMGKGGDGGREGALHLQRVTERAKKRTRTRVPPQALVNDFN